MSLSAGRDAARQVGRRVLVTRPPDQAREWVGRLVGHGIDAVGLPLIDIGPLGNPRPVAEAWRSLGGRHALMFVSANAVVQFFAARPAGASWPVDLLAAAPGPGTSAALREAGVPAGAIVEPDADAGHFDSESLWSAMSRRVWPGRSVLILRGASDETDAQGQGREWLAERLRGAGASVSSLAVYRRGPPAFDAAQSQRWQAMLDAPSRHLALISSSEALDHGEVLAQAQQRAEAWHALAIVATHPRIAQHARDLGFAEVIDAKASLVELIETLKSHGAVAASTPR